nr:10178_t:CDS:2 [Entrophospora candida]
MNPKILQKSKGRDTDDRLLEHVWQMEFYCASMQILSEDTYTSVDAEACFGSKGYIDFYVNDKKKWEIDSYNINKDKWALIDIHNSGMDASEPEQCEEEDLLGYDISDCLNDPMETD